MIIVVCLVATIVAHALYMIAEHQLLHGPVRAHERWEILYSASYHARYLLIVSTIMLGLAHCFS